MFNKEIYEKFKDHIILPDDFTSAVWTYCKDSWEVSWNEYGNVRDLVEGEDDTYSAEVRYGNGAVVDNYILFNLRDYRGDTSQAIFDLSKKVDVDKYWEES